MANILCKNSSGTINWRDEGSTNGFYKLKKNSSTSIGWHLAEDSGNYLFKDGTSVGWRNKSFNITGYTYSSGPAVTFDNYRFSNALYNPSNGKVYFVPWVYNYLVEYDPTTNTITDEILVSRSGFKQGAVTASFLINNKIIIIPTNNSTTQYIELYDISTKRFSQGATVVNNDSLRWAGGVLAPNGNIILVPKPYSQSSTTRVGVYNPSTNTYSPSGITDCGHIFGVLNTAENIILFPAGTQPNLTTIRSTERYTISSGDVTNLNIRDFPIPDYGALVPSIKKIVCCPESASVGVSIFSDIGTTWEVLPQIDSNLSQGGPFGSCAVDSSGNVILIPFYGMRLSTGSNSFFVIVDPVAKTQTKTPVIPNSGGIQPFFLGSCILPNGKIILAPVSYPNIGILTPTFS